MISSNACRAELEGPLCMKHYHGFAESQSWQEGTTLHVALTIFTSSISQHLAIVGH